MWTKGAGFVGASRPSIGRRRAVTAADLAASAAARLPDVLTKGRKLYAQGAALTSTPAPILALEMFWECLHAW